MFNINKIKENFNTKFVLIIGLFVLTFILFSSMSSDTRTIVDMAKNVVKLPDKIERVITLDPFSTQVMLGLGLKDILVDAQYGKNLIGEGFQKLVPEYTQWGLSFVGNSVMLEKLIEKKPDLIISQIGRPDLKKIMELNIPVVQLEVENDQALLGALNLCGEIFNKKEKAAELSRFISFYLNNFYKENLKNKNNKAKPKVYIAGSNLLRTFGTNSFQYWLVNISDAIFSTNKFDKVKVDINPETLIKLNPDYILLSKYTKETIDEILNDPRYSFINAIKNKNLYRFPSYILSWDVPSFEMIAGISYLKYLFNFMNLSDFKTTIKELYKICYGLDIDDQQIDNLLICR